MKFSQVQIGWHLFKSFKSAYSPKFTLSEGGSSSVLLLKRMYFFSSLGLAAHTVMMATRGDAAHSLALFVSLHF